MTNSITITDLVKAGVHFGHGVSKWNPKMKPYIHGKKNLIHIIDLRKTLRGIVRATNFVQKVSATGREVVYVSTKRQAKAILRKEAERCGMHWVTERWLGGTLTNHKTIRRRLKRLEFLEQLEQTGKIETYSKKMISSLRRERRKIHRNLEGIRNMEEIPAVLVAIDINRERNAIREANKLGLVTIGICDTDSDPDGVDILIPGNDDAFRSIEMLLRPITDAVLSGKRARSEGGDEISTERTNETAPATAPEDAAPAEVQTAPEAADTTEQKNEADGGTEAEAAAKVSGEPADAASGDNKGASE